MPFDGISIRALCRELNADLLDARIDKIFQPEKDELVLNIRQLKSGAARLLISANARWARMHTDSGKKTNPVRPPSFCMLLRKYLEGGKIKAIKQVDFERIIHIEIEALDDFREWKNKLLICEFMGRHSNIILVNPENHIIIDAIKKYGSDLSSYREVLPGKEYVHPPRQGKLNPLTAAYEEYTRYMWNQTENKTLSASLFQVFSGISPFSSRELCLAAGFDPDIPVEQCGELELSGVFNYIKSLLARIDTGNIDPVIVYQHSQPLEFSAFEITPGGGRLIRCPSMNTACDRFYGDKLEKVRLDSMKINLSRNIKVFLDKAYKKKFYQEGDLYNAQENMKYKIWGELLTAYGHLFEKGDTEVSVDNFYTGEKTAIKLDPRYTPIQNAQKYFKIYNKSRNALRHLETLMQKNQAEIDYLESVMVLVNQAESPAEVTEIVEELEREAYLKEHAKRGKHQELKSQPRRFLSSEGLEILVGRNNRQNDLLTLKQADRQDLWLHAHEIPGTHVIVKLPNKTGSIEQVPDATLEEAAGLAAYFSKAGQADKVPVDYTFRANVRKPGGAKPGMVIYDNYWTIMANPLSESIKKLINDF